MSQKVCTGPCGRTLPATTEHFYHSHGSELRADCKGCYNAGRTMKGKIHDPSDIPAGRKVPVIIQPSKPNIKVVSETVTQVEEHRLKRRVKELEEARQDLLKQIDEGNVYNDVLEQAYRLGPAIPTIARASVCRARSAKPRRSCSRATGTSSKRSSPRPSPSATATTSTSRTTHAALLRGDRVGHPQQQDTFTIRDIILWLGGDFIQNFLHEDDIENNLLRRSPRSACGSPR
jgi:hypothetical protein